jgi:hypothetical protein
MGARMELAIGGGIPWRRLTLTSLNYDDAIPCPHPTRRGGSPRRTCIARREASGFLRAADVFRDVHVLLQHSDKSSARYASAGRLMFGLENDWVWLSF